MQAVELAKQIFQNREVRIFGTSERPLFIASDIGEILGLTNVRASIAKFENYKKDAVNVVDTIGREQSVVALTEAGVISLILKSKKPIAKQFERWVLEDVLPTLRKTGKYNIQDTIENQNNPENTKNIEKQLEESINEIEILKEENKKLSESYKPTVTYHDCDINDFTNNPCVYLFHLKVSDYKFGISGEIDVRKTHHNNVFKKFDIEPRLIKLWKCETMQIMKDTEIKIKLLAKHNKILINKYDQTEIISTDNIQYIVDRINKYVDDQNAREIVFMRIKEKELDVAKINAENENLRLQIEFFKLKNNTPQYPQITDTSKSNNFVDNPSNDNIAHDENIIIDDVIRDKIIEIEDVQCTVDDKKEHATNWIKNNPPNDKETTKDYYTRYKQSDKVKFVMINRGFKPLVESFGYVEYKGSHGIRRWKTD